MFISVNTDPKYLLKGHIYILKGMGLRRSWACAKNNSFLPFDDTGSIFHFSRKFDFFLIDLRELKPILAIIV